MIWTTLIVSFLIMIIPADKQDVVGIYSLSMKGQANSTSWSISTLELNCDSTLSAHLRTHGGITRWAGFWTTHYDTLTVNVTPIVTEDGKKLLGSWENVNRFLIRKNKLIPIVTGIKDREIKDSHLLKHLNRTLKKDKYKKVEEKNCS
jgi:hypothetical protein